MHSRKVYIAVDFNKKVSSMGDHRAIFIVNRFLGQYSESSEWILVWVLKGINEKPR